MKPALQAHAPVTPLHDAVPADAQSHAAVTMSLVAVPAATMYVPAGADAVHGEHCRSAVAEHAADRKEPDAHAADVHAAHERSWAGVQADDSNVPAAHADEHAEHVVSAAGEQPTDAYVPAAHVAHRR